MGLSLQLSGNSGCRQGLSKVTLQLVFAQVLALCDPWFRLHLQSQGVGRNEVSRTIKDITALKLRSFSVLSSLSKQ